MRYEKRARRRTGVASTFLCDRVVPGEPVPVYLQRSGSFRLAAPGRAMIMIGPGTGIAPFRAFLQERQATGARGLRRPIWSLTAPDVTALSPNSFIG